MTEYYIALGANLGNRRETLQQALALLDKIEGIKVAAVSSFYETAPWGKINQPAFINGAAKLITNRLPEDLLDCCMEIERKLGRVRHEKWGPRTIDIDLLYSPGLRVQTTKLTLPHPLMFQRAFVLEPLAEIAGDIVYKNKTFAQYRDEIR
jgi:2-amino-4-hydroxy-6-hydroxymethyldihydropteridine diphosphokinase